MDSDHIFKLDFTFSNTRNFFTWQGQFARGQFFRVVTRGSIWQGPICQGWDDGANCKRLHIEAQVAGLWWRTKFSRVQLSLSHLFNDAISVVNPVSEKVKYCCVKREVLLCEKRVQGGNFLWLEPHAVALSLAKIAGAHIWSIFCIWSTTKKEILTSTFD